MMAYKYNPKRWTVEVHTAEHSLRLTSDPYVPTKVPVYVFSREFQSQSLARLCFQRMNILVVAGLLHEVRCWHEEKSIWSSGPAGLNPTEMEALFPSRLATRPPEDR